MPLSVESVLDTMRVQLNELLRERAAEAFNSNDAPIPIDAHLVRKVLAARRKRSRFVSSSLLGEPSWEMLLELLAAELEKQETSVSSLCIASDAPATTALRWMDKLEQEGLIQRRPDPADGRRIWVALSDKGRNAMVGYLTAIFS